MPETAPALLAVDVGLALYGRDGRLRWHRSQHLGTAAALRRAVEHWFKEYPSVTEVYLEGGGRLGEIWEHAARRRGIRVVQVPAERWREKLLYARQQRCGREAKRHAGDLARRVIAWSGAARPTSLRHDAAEAILIGLWGVLDAGWLSAPPTELRKG